MQQMLLNEISEAAGIVMKDEFSPFLSQKLAEDTGSELEFLLTS